MGENDIAIIAHKYWNYENKIDDLLTDEVLTRVMLYIADHPDEFPGAKPQRTIIEDLGNDCRMRPLALYEQEV